MRIINDKKFILLILAVFSLLIFWGGSCGGGTSVPGAYSYNAAVSTMGGTYISNVIPVHYYVSVTTNKEGTVLLGPAFGDIYSIIQFSTNMGVSYSLCHNTEGNPGDYFTFTEAPSTKEATFNWDVDRDLGAGVNVSECILRVRVFHIGDDPCSDAPADVEVTEEFAIALSPEGTDCGAAPAITTEGLPDATDGVPYSLTFESTGGYGELTWSLGEPINGAVVSGLSITPLGVLAGTPILQGEYVGTNAQVDVDVWLTDSCPEGGRTTEALGGRTDNKIYPLNILSPVAECEIPPEFYDDQVMPSGTEGVGYNYPLEVSYGELPLTFEIVLGGLPTGLMFAAFEGVVAGIPGAETAGEYPLTFRVTDSCPTPQTDEISLTLNIEGAVQCDPGPEITTTELDTGTVYVPYEFQMTATGGHGALVWSYVGDFPTGISMNGTGLISGTPSESGSFPLTIVVTDSCITPQTDSALFTLLISDFECDPPPEIDQTEMDSGTIGEPYSFQFTASNGHGALIWDSMNPWPMGISMTSDGLVSGTPEVNGSFPMTVQVADSCEPVPQTDNQFLTLVIDTVCEPPPEIQYDGLPTAYMGTPYEHTLTAINGEGDLTWSRLTGELPVELLLSSDGIISGDVSCDLEPMDFNFTVQVTDSCPDPQSDTQEMTITVEYYDCNPLAFYPDQSMPNPTVMEPYLYTVEFDNAGADNGEGTLSWSVEPGYELPAGLSFTDGVISGNPLPGTNGEHLTRINVSDSCPCNPQSDTIDLPFVISNTEHPCYSEPPFYHTFCLLCPPEIGYESGAEVALFFVPDPTMAPPVTVTLEITFDNTLCSIDAPHVAPGPVIPSPADFTASVVGSILTLSYIPAGPPIPMDEPGLFATIPVSNIYNDYGDQLDTWSINVTVLEDSGGGSLDWSSNTCVITIEGAPD